MDAGMNDFFVSKPIDIRALRGVLQRWVRPKPALGAAASEGLQRPGGVRAPLPSQTGRRFRPVTAASLCVR